MRGNSFGKLFTITTFGESHGEALGVVIDGVPAGLEVDLKELQNQLDKRRPGRLEVTTARNEADKAQILSGIFQEKTLGTPICVTVKNTNQRSQDYESIKNDYRPGHADKTTQEKFGHRDYRGGGRASGRETLSRVIAGYFAGLLIPKIKFEAKITSLGPYSEAADFKNPSTKDSSIGFINPEKDNIIKEYLLELKKNGNSVGGCVRLKIMGCPPALGEPVFDKLKAELSHAMLSIGSCMGISFGRGFDFSKLTGLEISCDTHNFSGIEGGISNGEEIYLDLVFKAPSTVGKKALEGRHDPCILPRVLPVVESMAKVVIADQLLRQNAFQLD